MKKHIGNVNSNNNLNNENGSNKSNNPSKRDNMANLQPPITINQFNQDVKKKDRDIILKTKYSAALKSSAENFLIDLFEKISTLNDFDNVDIEIPISVAMAIISNISWHQPTEAQVEYDFTRECMDNGLYNIQLVDDIEEFKDNYEDVEEQKEENSEEESKGNSGEKGDSGEKS